MSKLFIQVFVLLSFILVLSCKNDKVEKNFLNVEGRWEMYEAYRNDVETNTLEDGYFLFQDSILETNIIGSPITGPFSVGDKSFTHKSDLPVTYDVAYFNNDTLHLTTLIQGFKFDFMLHKVMDTIPQ